MTAEEIRKRVHEWLNNTPICDDEELFIYLWSKVPNFAEIESELRQAYREWSKTEFAKGVERV